MIICIDDSLHRAVHPIYYHFLEERPENKHKNDHLMAYTPNFLESS